MRGKRPPTVAPSPKSKLESEMPAGAKTAKYKVERLTEAIEALTLASIKLHGESEPMLGDLPGAQIKAMETMTRGPDGNRARRNLLDAREELSLALGEFVQPILRVVK